MCINQYLSPSLNCGVKLQCFSFALELSVNGELESSIYGGFKRIVIHLKTDNYIDVDSSEIVVTEGSRISRYTAKDHITVGR